MDKVRFAPLDGLRALAVIFVVAFHYINNQLSPLREASLNQVERGLMKITYFGWCGVDLFFVLSGFLIGRILLSNRGSNNFFKAFYVRRFMRIIPIYYLLLFVFLALQALPVYDVGLYIFEKPIPTAFYFAFVQNFLMGYHNHFGPGALTPTWSLAVEEQFYLFIPLIVYWVKPKYLIFVIIAFIIIAPLSRSLSTNFYQQYALLTSRIDSPGFGFLLAWLLRIESVPWFIRNNIVAIQRFSLLLFVISGILYVKADVGVFNHSLIALNFTLLLVIVLFTEKTWIGKVLATPFLVRIGVLSYFIYLFHQLINGLLHYLVLNQCIGVLDGVPSLLVTIAALFLTFSLASVSYRFIEKPIIAYSHTFKY